MFWCGLCKWVGVVGDLDSTCLWDFRHQRKMWVSSAESTPGNSVSDVEYFPLTVSLCLWGCGKVRSAKSLSSVLCVGFVPSLQCESQAPRTHFTKFSWGVKRTTCCQRIDLTSIAVWRQVCANARSQILQRDLCVTDYGDIFFSVRCVSVCVGMCDKWSGTMIFKAWQLRKRVCALSPLPLLLLTQVTGWNRVVSEEETRIIKAQ